MVEIESQISKTSLKIDAVIVALVPGNDFSLLLLPKLSNSEFFRAGRSTRGGLKCKSAFGCASGGLGSSL